MIENNKETRNQVIDMLKAITNYFSNMRDILFKQ